MDELDKQIPVLKRQNYTDLMKPLVAVLDRDGRWRGFGNRTIEQHHALIAQYSLHDGVPSTVAQHFENTRNTWLYAFFSYRLLQVAFMKVHVDGEAAIKERARREGINLKSKQADTLEKLLGIALVRHWSRTTRSAWRMRFDPSSIR